MTLPTAQNRDRLSEFELTIACGQGSGDKEHLEKLNKARAEYDKTITSVMVMEDMATPRPTFVLKARAVRHARHEPEGRAGRSLIVAEANSGPTPNRLGLARWLVSPENPLTARVEVNRIWQHHFGQGLVKTAENFGVQGEPPTHPELLDWLATELVRTGWDFKVMHRLIVTSATYRQSSTRVAGPARARPGQPAAARGPRFRFSAEVVAR